MLLLTGNGVNARLTVSSYNLHQLMGRNDMLAVPVISPTLLEVNTSFFFLFPGFSSFWTLFSLLLLVYNLLVLAEPWVFVCVYSIEQNIFLTRGLEQKKTQPQKQCRDFHRVDFDGPLRVLFL